MWLVKLPTIALLQGLQSDIKARGCIYREAEITEFCQTKQQLHASRQAAPLKAVKQKREKCPCNDRRYICHC